VVVVGESRRARKKQQTRNLIARAAIRLFAKHGYQRTTIAQIAAEADVAAKTFFNYFPTKEAVLFADAEQIQEMVTAKIAEHLPGERPAQVLIGISDWAIEEYPAQAILTEPGLAEVYQQIVSTVPTVQAMALRTSLELQRAIARTLHRAFPDDLDLVTAAAAVGAITGAVQAVGYAIDDDMRPTPEEQRERARRAMQVAIAGLRDL
jgi:AcrR family transcriptional regulator